MTKDEIVKKHKQYLFPSISTYYSDPLVTDHASMQHLWDVEGNKYLDFFGGIVTISVGHANPRVTVELGTETFEANAVPLNGAERDEAYRQHSEQYPQFAEYQANTTRTIPVVALERVK